MILNQRGQDLIKKWEGCKLVAYQCSAGIWTIGYGNTFYADGKVVKEGDKITMAQAVALFPIVAGKFVKEVNSLIGKTILHDNQFASLVSFAYNLGSDIDMDEIPEGLGDSTLLKKVLKNPNDPTIKAEFMKWNKAKGKVVAGLTNRRADEAILYFTK